MNAASRSHSGVAQQHAGQGLGANPWDLELKKMSKLVTIAAVALTLGLGAVGPAFADGQGYGPGQTHGQSNHDNDRGNGDRNGPGSRNGDDDRGGWQNNGNPQSFGDDRGAWERTWRPWQNQAQYSRFQVLPRAKIIRKLERQGYYDIRDLRPSPHGQGWRAVARIGRGAYVMLRVDPRNGRVLATRRV